ncbi:uncharacterized protein METZ01_LOCUS219523, partial [marine metagenome]
SYIVVSRKTFKSFSIMLSASSKNFNVGADSDRLYFI